MKILLALTSAYLAGGFPTGVLVCRWLHHKDVRKFGSGNPGAINVWRVFGFGYGLLVVSVDIGKGYFAAGVIPHFVSQDYSPVFALTLGILAICGHIWSPFTRLRGGKGVGAALGVGLALYPMAASIAFAVWIGIMLLTRIASVSSLLATATYPVAIYWKYDPSAMESSLSILLILLILFAHRSNLQRLQSGQELKIGGS